jgi:hypothetical protein
MLYRIFECTPEYFAADYNNPHLDDIFPKETDFFSRDLAQVALHRFKNKDVVLGSFIPDAVVLGIRGMMLHKRPTAIQSLHFKRGLRLDTVLDIFSNYANPDNSFEKVTKNCMWVTGSMLWDILTKYETFLRIPSRMSYTDFVSHKMQALREHGMMPWLRWMARAFWSSRESWLCKLPLSREERTRNTKKLLASLERQKGMEEANQKTVYEAHCRTIQELKDNIDRLRDDLSSDGR